MKGGELTELRSKLRGCNLRTHPRTNRLFRGPRQRRSKALAPPILSSPRLLVESRLQTCMVWGPGVLGFLLILGLPALPIREVCKTLVRPDAFSAQASCPYVPLVTLSGDHDSDPGHSDHLSRNEPLGGGHVRSRVLRPGAQPHGGLRPRNLILARKRGPC